MCGLRRPLLTLRRAQSPPNLERNPMAAQLFEKEQQARPQPLC